MIVWCVIEGFEYEGDNFNSLQIFASEEKAREYYKQRKIDIRGIGNITIESREVIGA